MKINDMSSTDNANLFVGEQYFSIQDQGMIFDILRNKMYSDPISAICREISCNARDAHREVGTPDKPIHIYLPNNVEPFLKIKDFGPGISPERISNIFIKYAASTKRNDNIQTGGFGLGAKTPFSYSDSFNIITNYNGNQYNYVCFIDETKIGKITLLSETVTTEPNGTEIVVPVKPFDFRSFASSVEASTRHWSVKPIIKGMLSNDFAYRNKEIFLDGTNWQIAAHSDYNRAVKAIVDEIEYPLPDSQLRSFVPPADLAVIDSCRGDILLKFGVGELSLSANREQIYFDKNTKSVIKDSLQTMREDLKNVINAKLDSFPNLWEANVAYFKHVFKLFNSPNVLGNKINWKNNPLSSSPYLDLGCTVYNYHRSSYRNYKNSLGKVRRNTGNNVSFSENSVLMVNDTSLIDVTPKHLKKFFEQNTKVNSVQLVCPHGNDGKITLDYLNQNFNFNLWYPTKLSDHVNISNRSARSSSSRLIVYKFEPSSKFMFKQISISSIDSDLNTKILCKIEKDSHYNDKKILFNGNRIYNNAITKFFNRNRNYSLYAVDATTSEEKIQDNFEDFESLEDFIERQVFEDETIDYNQLSYAVSMTRKVNHDYCRNANKFRELINNPNSCYLSLIHLHEKINNLVINKGYLLELYEICNQETASHDAKAYLNNHPEEDFVAITDKVNQTYPLLTMTLHVDYGANIGHIAHYINLVDNQLDSK